MPKRGYRLRLGAAAPAQRRRARRLIAVPLALVAVAGIALGTFASRREPVAVAVGHVANATGDARFDPLATALTELIATRLPADELEIVRAAGADADIRLSGRLILWNGEPTLALAAARPSGSVLWSEMARGPERRLPASTSAALGSFVAQLREGGGGAN